MTGLGAELPPMADGLCDEPTLPLPYYSDGTVTLYHGRMQDVVPLLDPVDLICTDPPYGETSLEWDRWPSGWPAIVAPLARSMWCFGSMRMFLDHVQEFNGWKFAQDVVWRKQQGTGLQADRFRRIHEHTLHFYRGEWSQLHRQVPRVVTNSRATVMHRDPASSPTHQAATRSGGTYETGGTALEVSVLNVRNMHGRASHPTEKPTGILEPLIAYSCRPGGTVLDVFAGSGSTLDAARRLGRKAIGVEADEGYCEVIANRMRSGVLDFGGAA